MINFIKRRIVSIGYAFKGTWILTTSEASIKVQILITLILTFMGFYLNITKAEWLAQIIIIGMVLSTEGLNTAIEKLADYIQPNHDPKIGLIKDIAAGAVCFSALCGIIVLSAIYLPKLF